MNRSPRVAVLIPCYNEEVAICQVVADFRAALPQAEIHVFDNNSTDLTAQYATEAGAIVHSVQLKGKGNVVRRMFADVEADAYVMADGDDTYHAQTAREMVDRLFAGRLDMVVGRRVSDEQEAYRAGHRFGNWMLTEFVARLFGRLFTDILSGYRVFSRRFAKSFPAQAIGFEIETELTIHALHLRMPLIEVETPYKDRPSGSISKLSTYRDGLRILWKILVFIKEDKPMAFFSLIALAFCSASVILALPILQEYIATGLVPRLPTAVLSMGMMTIAFLSLACGLILDTVTRGRSEMKRMRYLSTPAAPLSS